MIKKYKELWIVKLKSLYINAECDNCVLIRNEEGLADYDVDLASDCWFNTEFKIDEVYNKIPINSLEDVLDYCKEHDITIKKERLNIEGIIVGGGKDFLITNDLNGDWISGKLPHKLHADELLEDATTIKITIYDSNGYFIKKNDKWYLVRDGIGEEVTDEDCDIKTLECGENGDTVYGSAVFG